MSITKKIKVNWVVEHNFYKCPMCDGLGYNPTHYHVFGCKVECRLCNGHGVLEVR